MTRLFDEIVAIPECGGIDDAAREAGRTVWAPTQANQEGAARAMKRRVAGSAAPLRNGP